MLHSIKLVICAEGGREDVCPSSEWFPALCTHLFLPVHLQYLYIGDYRRPPSPQDLRKGIYSSIVPTPATTCDNTPLEPRGLYHSPTRTANDVEAPVLIHAGHLLSQQRLQDPAPGPGPKAHGRSIARGWSGGSKDGARMELRLDFPPATLGSVHLTNCFPPPPTGCIKCQEGQQRGGSGGSW